MQLLKGLEDVISWSAASRLTVDRWQRRAAPTSYALQAVEAAQQDVRAEATTLAGIDGIEPAERDRARAACQRVADLCASLHAALEQSDGAAAATIASNLAQVERDLRHMARGTGP